MIEIVRFKFLFLMLGQPVLNQNQKKLRNPTCVEGFYPYFFFWLWTEKIRVFFENSFDGKIGKKEWFLWRKLWGFEKIFMFCAQGSQLKKFLEKNIFAWPKKWRYTRFIISQSLLRCGLMGTVRGAHGHHNIWRPNIHFQYMPGGI